MAIIAGEVAQLIGEVPPSSIRSYLRLNTPELFARSGRAQYALNGLEYLQEIGLKELGTRSEQIGNAMIVHQDCLNWLERQTPNSFHAVVTDPPYGLIEYSELEQKKLRAGRGVIWRIPPSFDGTKRSPLPRFTVLKTADLDALEQFFVAWAARLLPTLVPGANVVVASNPLLSYVVSGALSRAVLERRGEIARLVMTMRGGDRPKDAHIEFADVSVMPRSMWEPWLVFRKPLQGRVQDNLRR